MRLSTKKRLDREAAERAANAPETPVTAEQLALRDILMRRDGLTAAGAIQNVREMSDEKLLALYDWAAEQSKPKAVAIPAPEPEPVVTVTQERVLQPVAEIAATFDDDTALDEEDE